MILKIRYESEELKIMNLLEFRMVFTEKERQRHFSLRKGYDGEVQFDRWMEGLEIEKLTLNDLLLEADSSTFQIDSNIITQDKIFLFEIKNYEGDYYYEDERFKKINGNEIKDPLLQLKRSTSLLRQLLDSLGFHFEIESYVLFINPEFTLYQAPKNAPIILPSQLTRFMKKLNKKQSKLTNLHRKLAEKLLEMHKVDNPYKRVPRYEWEQLRKGITCPSCHTFIENDAVKKTLIHCTCGAKEEIENVVMKSVSELNLLFPNRKITTNLIYEWSNGVLPKRAIRRVLNKNLELTGHAQWSYFK